MINRHLKDHNVSFRHIVVVVVRTESGCADGNALRPICDIGFYE